MRGGNSIMPKSRFNRRKCFRYVKRILSVHPEGSYLFAGSIDHKTGEYIEKSFVKEKGYVKLIVDFMEGQHSLNRSVYLCPNASKSKKRIEKEMLPTPYVWADMDKIDPDILPINAAHLLETSNGSYQVIYQMNRKMKPKVAMHLSKSLAYLYGGDKNGWNITKMLRIPGTVNFKPNRNKELVCIISSSFIKYARHSFEKILRDLGNATGESSNPEPDRGGDGTCMLDPSIQSGIKAGIDKDFDLVNEVIKELSKSLSTSLSELAVAKRGDRSDAIFNMVRLMSEKEISVENMACYVFNSEAFSNKHNSRKDRLISEFKRILPKIQIEAKDKGPQIRCFDEIESKQAEYWWPTYLPKYMLTMLDADSGVGKSMLTTYIAARFTRGDSIFNGDKIGSECKVLFLSAEDHPSYTQKPRLEKFGANTSLVYFAEEAFSLNDDGMKYLEIYIKLHRPALVVIDPMINFMDGVDNYSASSVAPFMNRLRILCTEYETTIICVRHLTKSKTGSTIDAGQGTAGLIGGVRSGLILIFDADEPDTVRNLLHIKSNIGPKSKPIKYELRSDNYKEVPEIIFLGEMDRSTDDLFRKSVDYSEKTPTKKAQAIMLWNTLLAKGPVKSSEINEIAKELEITKSPLEDARNELGLEHKRHKDGTTTWFLP